MTETKKGNKVLKTVDLVYIAVAAVLIAICSWISIPTLVPFTMQTFGVFCVLSILGGKRGTMAIILYLMIGVIGVPVFANFSAGIGAFLDSSGGYLLGFIFIGLVYWLAVRLFGKSLWVEIVSLTVGLLVCYAFGTVWFIVVYTRTGGAVGLSAALAWCVFPFFIPDLVKLGLALMLAGRLPALPGITKGETDR